MKLIPSYPFFFLGNFFAKTQNQPCFLNDIGSLFLQLEQTEDVHVGDDEFVGMLDMHHEAQHRQKTTLCFDHLKFDCIAGLVLRNSNFLESRRAWMSKCGN